MITNIDSISRKFKCKKKLAQYLIYNKKLPILSVDEDYYYFLDNEVLQKALESTPFWIKILNGL